MNPDDQKRQQRFDREVNRATNSPIIAVRSVTTERAKGPRTRVASKEKGAIRVDLREEHSNRKKEVRKVKKKAQVLTKLNNGELFVPSVDNKRLMAYLDFMAHPFTAQFAHCPINYNPVPSFLIVPYSASSSFDLAAAPNSCVEIGLWPGHTESSDADPMDGAAYHSNTQNIGGTNYNIGPLQYASGTIGQAIGYFRTGIGLGLSSNSTSAAGNSPIQCDVLSPFTGSGGDFHSRWKLISMGIEVMNVTPMNLRGGDIVYVMPSNPVSSSVQTGFSKDPSFTETSKANDGMLRIPITPQPTQLAYWHSVGSPVAVAYPDNASFRMWLRNPNSAAGSDQTYRVHVRSHWELAGNNYAAIGSPTIHAPALKNVIEPVLDVVKSSGTSIGQAVGIGKAVLAMATDVAPPRLAQHLSTLGEVGNFLSKAVGYNL